MSDISNSTTTSTHMKGLLNEFKHLYESRLDKIDSQIPLTQETIQLKIKTLESYTKDLIEQNDVLVQTIAELEKEANSRVSRLESKLQHNNIHSQELTKRNRELENEMKSLKYNDSFERELRVTIQLL
jgi:chromosome segregation ATPase